MLKMRRTAEPNLLIGLSGSTSAILKTFPSQLTIKYCSIAFIAAIETKGIFPNDEGSL